jgi:spore coat polysaccharide biosynthesis predicted glycosyltransferase SpsG
MLALGQLLSDWGYEVHFATIPYDSSILDYLKDEPFPLQYLKQEVPWDASKDLDRLLCLASRIRPSWVVLDGGHFGADYEHGIKQCGFKLLRIDDIPSNHYYADVLLNQNYGAEEMICSTEPNTRVLAGLKYVLLRREFREIDSSSKKARGNGRFHLLVSLGGSSERTDTLNSMIVQGLSNICEKHLSATLIVGKMGGRISHLEKVAKNISWPIQIKDQSRNVAAEMLKADLAIVSGGSTMWELMYMRVPFLAISITLAQRSYLRLLSERGLCVNLGWHEDLTPDSVHKSALDLIHDNIRRRQMRIKTEGIMDRDNVGGDLLEVLDKSN